MFRTLKGARARNMSGRVRRFARSMFLAAVDGDSTRWSLARTPVPGVPSLKARPLSGLVPATSE